MLGARAVDEWGLSGRESIRALRDQGAAGGAALAAARAWRKDGRQRGGVRLRATGRRAALQAAGRERRGLRGAAARRCRARRVPAFGRAAPRAVFLARGVRRARAGRKRRTRGPSAGAGPSRWSSRRRAPAPKVGGDDGALQIYWSAEPGYRYLVQVSRDRALPISCTTRRAPKASCIWRTCRRAPTTCEFRRSRPSARPARSLRPGRANRRGAARRQRRRRARWRRQARRPAVARHGLLASCWSRHLFAAASSPALALGRMAGAGDRRRGPGVVLDRSGWLQGPNRLIQDALMSLQRRAVDRSDVIIVAIDDKSIAALGRWPWRRSFHAELIDRIDKDAPRAIGMDVLLTEADLRFPGDDAALAAALSRSGKVVLPLMMQSLNGVPSVVEPHPRAAAPCTRPWARASRGRRRRRGTQRVPARRLCQPHMGAFQRSPLRKTAAGSGLALRGAGAPGPMRETDRPDGVARLASLAQDGRALRGPAGAFPARVVRRRSRRQAGARKLQGQVRAGRSHGRGPGRPLRHAGLRTGLAS